MNKKYILILSILAIGIFALGVHLATAGPVEVQIGDTTVSFLPLVMTSKAADAPSGVLYVFWSTDTTDGYAGGRSAIGQICPSQDPDSHFCSLQEIENAIGTSGVYFENPFSDAWLDNFSTWQSETENCNGWINNTSFDGQTIIAAARAPSTASCSTDQPVACCKQMP
jgi:hypothetical protein